MLYATQPSVTGSGGADVCLGGQIQAGVAAFRAHPAAPLRLEIDGVHPDQCEAVLWDLKLATTCIGMQQLFDMVWNAYGLSRSFNYDEQGNWKGR